MVKSMASFKETFKAEVAAQNEAKRKAKEERKKANEAKGPLWMRVATQSKNICVGGLYSIIYLAVVYCVIMFGTLYLPTLLNVVINYFDANTVLVLSVNNVCLFFTAWMFVISFVVVRAATKIYKKAINKLFRGESAEK